MGVDMVWVDVFYGYIGLDIIGVMGGFVCIDDIEIVDVINVFICDMMGVVDVCDYGVVGDGIMDDIVVFEVVDVDVNG